MLRKITVTFGLFCLCITLAMIQNTYAQLKVVTTLFPTYDFAKQIGKDKVDVRLLLPPGVESHGFEPRPKDVVTINKADVFVYTGEFMEPWAEDILDGVTNKKLVVVDSSKGIELMDEEDHHDHHGHGGEHAFEWAGAFHLPVGKYTWTFAKVDGAYADPAMKMVFVSSKEKGIEAIESQEEAAENMLEMEDTTPRGHGQMLSPNGQKAYKLTFDQNRDVTEFTIVIKKEGSYAFFTEHMPFEFEADEHFLKDSKRKDVEPFAQEPDAGHEHHHGGEHGFEWAGAFDLPAGKYVWTFAKVDGDYADPAMKMVFISSTEKGIEAIESQEEMAEKMLEMEDATPRGHGQMLSPNGQKAYKLTFDQNREVTEFPIVIKKGGVYAFFTEHMPFEFEADEHFLKDSKRQDVEPIAQEPDAGHDHGHGHGHGHGHHHGGKDPHIWVDLAHAQQMVDTIAQSLAQKDPKNKNFYLKNAAAYNAKLAALDTRFHKTLSTCKHKTILYGGHFAFGYFAKRYGLSHESPYEGFAPNAEPSPKAIAELIEKVKDTGMKYIYHEELLDPKVARTVAQETGVKLELLHGAHNVSKRELKSGLTYLDIMEANYDKLKVGLSCQ